MASKIKKGDTVIVLTGRDKGRSGEVLKVIPADDRVLVDGVNMVKKHRKPSPTSQGGIETIAAPLHISNVAHKDPRSGKATRIGFKVLEDGRKVRFAKASGEVIDR
jgi:large subunit ribosomal protein L24